MAELQLDTVDTVLFGKPRRFVGPATDDYISYAATDAEQIKLRTVVSQFVPPDGVVLDIGANIGAAAVTVADAVPAGTVYSVEAAPGIFRLLQENLTTNSVTNVRAFNFAAGSENGREVHFFEASAFGHVVSAPGPNTTTVPMRTVDDLVANERLRRVDLVKIDVEGFERKVLGGMTRTLMDFRPIVFMEFNSWTTLALARDNPFEFLEYLMGRFPSVSYFDEDLVLKPLVEPVGFLHRNLMQHGCVDDIVLAHRPLIWDHHKVQHLIQPVTPPQPEAEPVGVPIEEVARLIGHCVMAWTAVTSEIMLLFAVASRMPMEQAKAVFFALPNETEQRAVTTQSIDDSDIPERLKRRSLRAISVAGELSSRRDAAIHALGFADQSQEPEANYTSWFGRLHRQMHFLHLRLTNIREDAQRGS